MANKHMVKCSVCGEYFDAETTPYEKTHKGRRYAHVYCIEHRDELISQDQKDKEQLEGYLKEILQVEQLTPRFYKSLNDFIKLYNSINSSPNSWHWNCKKWFKKLVWYWFIWNSTK